MNTKFENILNNDEKNKLDTFPTLDECMLRIYNSYYISTHLSLYIFYFY